MMILGKSIFLFFVSTILQVQRCGSAKYCQEAVDSVKTVQSCPTSKTEWDAAARRKNCSSIASKQSCSLVDKFVYHCVINGYRNVTLEVCAPSRIIFGHCVEFNVAGGVIQDQFSARCNESFPKCDSHYLSSTAYKSHQHGGIHTTKCNTHARVKTEVYILSGSYKRLKTYRYQGRSMSPKKIKCGKQ